MSRILRQAEQTRSLAGRRIRTLDTRLIAVLLVLEIMVVLFGASALGLPLAACAGLAVLAVVAQTLALRSLWSRGVRANNDGVEALGLDRFDEAERGFRQLLTRRHPKSYTALGLQNLSTVAIQRGELQDGALLSRAAMEILSRTRPRATVELFAGHIRANYAFALLANGEIDEAEAVLRPAAEPGALAKSEALLVRARALALVRRERWEEAATLLAAERRLLRNTLTGDEAVLAEALEAWSLHHLSRPHLPIVVDDQERTFVTRILPGCEVVLARE